MTKGRIAPAHGRFNRIRQVALMCTPSTTCFLGCTQVQISIGSCTAYGRHSLHLTMNSPLSPQNCPLQGGSGPHLIHGSLGPLESTTQMDWCLQGQPTSDTSTNSVKDHNDCCSADTARLRALSECQPTSNTATNSVSLSSSASVRSPLC